jgi:hypothetical protein
MNKNTNQYLSYTSDCKSPPNALCTIENSLGCDVYKNKTCTNSGFNQGFSSRLQYDPSFIQDDIEQSVAPLQSVLDPNRVKNCSQCFALNTRANRINSYGDNTTLANSGLTPAQELTDIDSIMKNLNVKASRDKRGMINNIDVFKFKTYDTKLCDRGLDPLSSISTYPKQLYREMSINRFYDLNINPQVNIFWNWAVNSQLEAKDNYDNPYPYSIDHDKAGGDQSLPKAIAGKSQPCKMECKSNCGTKVLVRNPLPGTEDSDGEYDY